MRISHLLSLANGLVEIYGISTIEGYSMPNPVYYIHDL